MKLTEKCKEEFEKWFVVVFLKHSLNYYESTDKTTKEYVRIDLKTFYTKNKSMQYGVFVDFFGSVGIYIQLMPYFHSVKEVVLWFFTFKDERCVHLNSHLENKAKTRPEARTKAIEKANELFNKN
jgi:hypothetical protein